MAVTFTSPSRTLGEIQDLALNRVRPQFATLPGVSSPPPFGGNQRAIVVSVDAAKLRGYGMSPEQVIPGGRAFLVQVSPWELLGAFVGSPGRAHSVRRNAATLRGVAEWQEWAESGGMEGAVMDGHAFKPGRRTRRWIGCAVCGQPIGAVVHVLAFAGMEAADREAEEVRQQAEAAELTATLIEPRPSIDGKVGKMERESPLFYGTGKNPTLF